MEKILFEKEICDFLKLPSIPKKEWDELASQIAEKEGMKADGRKIAELGGLHVIGTERHDRLLGRVCVHGCENR